MKKNNFIWSVAVVFIVLMSAVSGVQAQNGMGDYSKDITVSATSLHEWMPSVTYNPIENEFLVLWHSTGVRVEGGENMYSLHGRRIDPDGNLLADPLSPIQSVGPERRLLPRAAYNPFINEYMVSFVMGQEVTEWDPFVTRFDSVGNITLEAFPLSEQLTKANHANIVFNSKRRQYLVVYNDSRYGAADIFGVIIDENGGIVKEDFPINISSGQQMNAYACYNSTDDTYLINWEDFRHAATWQEPGDIYGALLNGDGDIIINDIAMCDDYGKENAGDQRVQNIAYNPTRNEFLATWWDSRPSLDSNGIIGRIIKSDGSPAGPDFVVADAPRSQSFPHVVYIENKKKYFAIWDDSRNTEATGADIYARWLDKYGQPAGDDFPICNQAGGQHYSELAYSPLMDRFLIVWRVDVEDEPTVPGGSGHVKESGGNVMGRVYGMPSFLTCRIVEQGTGKPVEKARVIVLGRCIPSIETTNAGGWVNIPKRMQANSTYLIIALKNGYKTGFKSLTCTGEPMQDTLALTKR
jgi:hypothetical protein